MARQRFIWPSIWDDPDLARLDAEARLLYIACFSLADDDGRLIGEPVHLRATVFKYQPLTDRKVRDIRDRVAGACGNFRVYNVRGTDYIAFKNWSEFQKPKYPRPSKLPAPPWDKKRRNTAPLSQNHSGNGSGNTSPKLPEGLTE
jgi:hypothetical protein